MANRSRRHWFDGPLLRAMRQARFEPVLLFLNEVGVTALRANPAHPPQYPAGPDEPQVGAGLPAARRVVFFTARIVAAWQRRFASGRAYQVYDLDPAVRRRFDTVGKRSLHRVTITWSTATSWPWRGVKPLTWAPASASANTPGVSTRAHSRRWKTTCWPLQEIRGNPE